MGWGGGWGWRRSGWGGIRVCDCQLWERDPPGRSEGSGEKERKEQKSGKKGEQVSREMGLKKKKGKKEETKRRRMLFWCEGWRARCSQAGQRTREKKIKERGVKEGAGRGEDKRKSRPQTVSSKWGRKATLSFTVWEDHYSPAEIFSFVNWLANRCTENEGRVEARWSKQVRQTKCEHSSFKNHRHSNWHYIYYFNFPGSVPLSRFTPKVNGVHFGLTPGLHSIFVEICFTSRFCVILLTN